MAYHIRRHDPVDVLVIGSGMGGAIASRVLAEAGLRVVCLEQGDWTRPETRSACRAGLGMAPDDQFQYLAKRPRTRRGLSHRHDATNSR